MMNDKFCASKYQEHSSISGTIITAVLMEVPHPTKCATNCSQALLPSTTAAQPVVELI